VPALLAALEIPGRPDSFAQAVTACFKNMSAYLHLEAAVWTALQPVVTAIPKICSDANDDATVVANCSLVQHRVSNFEARMDEEVNAEEAWLEGAANDAFLNPE